VCFVFVVSVGWDFAQPNRPIRSCDTVVAVAVAERAAGFVAGKAEWFTGSNGMLPLILYSHLVADGYMSPSRTPTSIYIVTVQRDAFADGIEQSYGRDGMYRR